MKQNNTMDLVEMLFQISRLMKQEMSFSRKRTHLSMLQIQTLLFIYKNKNISMSKIAEYFQIELPSATSLINTLCDQKFVIRVEDPHDRRLVRITLTEEGKTLLEKVKHEHKNKVKKILSYLSEKEKSDLFNILQTLYTRLQQ